MQENQTAQVGSLNIRLSQPKDFNALAEVMFDAVRNGKSAYSEQQRSVWVPKVRGGSEWSARLCEQLIFVGEQDEEIVGFMSLAEHGYIDLAFIRPKHQRTGLFRRLYKELERAARDRGEARLWVHASLMAEPAFSAMGFEILQEQTVAIGNQHLRRFEMQKLLAPPCSGTHGLRDASEPS